MEESQVIPRRRWAILLRACRSRRDAALVGLLLWCGLQVQELCLLDRSDVTIHAGKPGLPEGVLRVRAWDDATARSITLPREAIRLLQEYLPERPEPRYAEEADALFVTNHKVRICPRQVQRIVREVGEAAGEGSISPRTLRASCGVRVWQRTKSLTAIMDHLGITEDSARVYARSAGKAPRTSIAEM